MLFSAKRSSWDESAPGRKQIPDGVRLAFRTIDRLRSRDSCSISRQTELCIRHLNRNGIGKIDLSNCFLINASLRGVNLEQAVMRCADLKNSFLMEAKLTRSDLREANLEGADLEGADLTGAKLIRADLKNAYLKHATLSRANLTKADLSGANLLNTCGLTLGQLSKVRTLYNTKLDAELIIQVRLKYPLLLKKVQAETDRTMALIPSRKPGVAFANTVLGGDRCCPQ